MSITRAYFAFAVVSRALTTIFGGIAAYLAYLGAQAAGEAQYDTATHIFAATAIVACASVLTGLVGSDAMAKLLKSRDQA